MVLQLILFILMMTVQVLHAKFNEYLMLDEPGWNPGFFCCFQVVVGCLDEYDKNQYAGLHVDFKNGLYFNPSSGPNWWEYYFDPIKLGSSVGAEIIHIGDLQKSIWTTDAISKISRERASYLISKYIKIRKHIQQKIDAFAAQYLQGKFVIGIHYRGTDKSSEAPRVSYSQVYEAIETFIKKNRLGSYTIFVATDEQQFINYIQNCYPTKVCYIDALRSEGHNPIHYNQAHNVRQGEESVIDCFLLAKSNVLIRTHSNLSSSAANINPTLPVINLNHATYFPGLRESCFEGGFL